MGRWSQYDTDEERLPGGMQRIGYDADTETYTFRDTDGSIYESAPGNRYGNLTRISGPPQATQYNDDEDAGHESAPPPYTPSSEPTRDVSWRHEMMPLLQFFMIIALFLIGVFWLLRTMAKGSDESSVVQCVGNTYAYDIKQGDTCWAIAEGRGLSVEDLVRANDGLDCDRLTVGATVCVPKT